MAGPDLPTLIRQVERSCRGTSLERLATAVALSDHLSSLADDVVGHFVAAARDSGASWAQIGVMLGVTKQAAQQRFVPARIMGDRQRGDTVLPRSLRRRDRRARTERLEGLFDRFDPRTERAVVLAQSEARALGHAYLGTEHLLLGVAAEAAERRGADRTDAAGLGPEPIRARIRAIVGQGSSDEPEGRIPFTPRAKKVLDIAWRECVRQNAVAVRPDHLFAAFLREREGIAAGVLREMGVDRGAPLGAILDLLGPAD
jgi:hypothetical protein